MIHRKHESQQQNQRNHSNTYTHLKYKMISQSLNDCHWPQLEHATGMMNNCMYFYFYFCCCCQNFFFIYSLKYVNMHFITCNIVMREKQQAHNQQTDRLMSRIFPLFQLVILNTAIELLKGTIITVHSYHSISHYIVCTLYGDVYI